MGLVSGIVIERLAKALAGCRAADSEQAFHCHPMKK